MKMWKVCVAIYEGYEQAARMAEDCGGWVEEIEAVGDDEITGNLAASRESKMTVD